MGTGGHVQLEDLTKRFADVAAVDHVTIDIAPGEFFSLLGPSGCGKTTTLRMIAGFEVPTGGSIHLDDADVTRLPPNRRNVNTVFQNYALFPFATVEANVAFGLRYQHLSKVESRRKVEEILELVQLRGFERRKPHQLSGGQQQRVALARALVLKPSVLLLDEPLGALDAKLRRALQVELKALQEQLGITFVFVTHDQEEALTMSDRLAVLSEGRVVQIGRPQEVYDEPVDAYVADFLGVSNLLDAKVTRAGTASGPCQVTVGSFALEAGCGATASQGRVRLAIRPERLRLHEVGTQGANLVPAMVERTVYLGAATQIRLRLPTGETLQALVNNTGETRTLDPGTPVSVHLDAAALRVLPDTRPEPVIDQDHARATRSDVDTGEGAEKLQV